MCGVCDSSFSYMIRVWFLYMARRHIRGRARAERDFLPIVQKPLSGFVATRNVQPTPIRVSKYELEVVLRSVLRNKVSNAFFRSVFSQVFIGQPVRVQSSFVCLNKGGMEGGLLSIPSPPQTPPLLINKKAHSYKPPPGFVWCGNQKKPLQQLGGPCASWISWKIQKHLNRGICRI